MKKLVVFMVVLALFSQPALAEEEVTVTVSVADPSGDAVRGVELTASWDDGSTTGTTASNGKAFLDVPAGQEVTIETDHDDYVRNRPYKIANAQEGAEEITVFPKASAVIQISDEDATVDDAHLVVRKSGKIAASGSTNENGVFETGVIEEGDYRVAISKPGYFEKYVDMSAEGDVEESVTIEQGSVTVSFNVTDDHFQKPKAVKNADVRITDIGSIKTRDNGQAALNLPVNSEFDVTVDKQGYSEINTEMTIDEQAKEIDFTLGRNPAITMATVNQKVVAGEHSRVEITNSYDEPVAGATVFLNGDEVGETNANGVFMVPIETKGNHTINAAKDGLESESVTVQAFATESEKQEGTDEESPGIAELGIQLVKQVVEVLVDKLVGALS